MSATPALHARTKKKSEADYGRTLNGIRDGNVDGKGRSLPIDTSTRGTYRATHESRELTTNGKSESSSSVLARWTMV